MYQLAELPDATVTKTADKFLDYGILGAVCIVLIVAAAYALRQLLECHKTNAVSAGTNATAIANHAAALDKVADSMQDVGRRLETIERSLERKS